MFRFRSSIRRYALAFLCAGLPSLVSHAQNAKQLCINEVMVANVDRYLDSSWNYGSWVEIYNGSNTEINLKRYSINTSDTNQGRIRINRDLVVAPQGHVVLWFDHKYWKAPTQIGAKLDGDGGYVTLFSPGATVLDRVEYPACQSRCSWARISDGDAQWTYTSETTPGASNGQLSQDAFRLPAPVVNTDSKYYFGYLSVNVDIPEGATLKYTTDGTTPSRTNGQVSETGAFRLATTRVYRFVLIRDGYLDSPVVTRTYIRKTNSINVPTVSIVTDPANLYSDSIGILVKGTNGRAGKGTSEPCNWNMDWDRPVNFEYIATDNTCRISQEVWMSRCGGHSKGYTPMSFKVRAAKDFDGQNTLDCAFFSDKPYLRHKALQFRGGGNDNECRIFDAAAQSVIRTSGIDLDLQDYQPVVHYINGRFMGTINMREPNNKHNVYANHGYSDDEIDMFEIDCDSCYVQMCGTADAWQELLRLSASASDDAAYQTVKDRLDIDEFCYYMAVQFYVGNVDWPQNNCKGWRPIADNGRFRFILYDLDLSFETDAPFDHFNAVANYTFCDLYDMPGVSRYTREVELVRLFQNLCKNKAFTDRFINTFTLVAGSVFEPARSRQVIERCVSVVEDVQLLASGYPGRNVSPAASAQRLISRIEGRSTAAFNALRMAFSSTIRNSSMREITLRANIPQARLLLNGQPIPLDRYSGSLFLPSTVEVMAPEGYRFLGWKDAKDGTVYGEEAALALTTAHAQRTVEATFEKDYAADAPPVVINEVSAGNSIYVNEYFKRKDWIELYNPSPSAVDVSGMYLSDDLSNPKKYKIEGPNTTIEAGGYKVVWCDGQTPQQYLHASFKLENADGALVMLSAADLSWQDTLVYCAHDGRESVGRYPDGGRQLYRFSRPSIGKGNLLNSYAERWEPLPQPVDPDGLLATSQGSLSITCQGGCLRVRGEGDALLTVYGTDGIEAMRETLRLDASPLSVPLHLLRSGIYVVVVLDHDGNVCRTKVSL